MIFIFNMKVMVKHFAKHISLESYIKKMRKYITDITKELKGARFLKRMYLIRTLCEYDESDKKVEIEIFIQSSYVKITQEFDFDVFVKRIFELIKKIQTIKRKEASLILNLWANNNRGKSM